jgi:hypothetical protein
MNTKLVAVVLHYYPQRSENVRKIIQDLKNSSRVPDKIIVFNNNKDMVINFEGVTNINSDTNFHSRAKYGVALLEPADYYILLDDDISVGKRTIEKLLEYATPDICTAMRGVNLSNGSFTYGTDVYPHLVGEPTKVDSFIGRLQFVSYKAIMNMLVLEPALRLDDKRFIYDAEDIFIGLVNDTKVYPLRGDELPYDTGENGVAYHQFFGDYGGLRDVFTRKVINYLHETSTNK